MFPISATAGRTLSAAGGIAATVFATIITTGTGTIGHRWASVRE